MVLKATIIGNTLQDSSSGMALLKLGWDCDLSQILFAVPETNTVVGERKIMKTLLDLQTDI